VAIKERTATNYLDYQLINTN